MRAFRRVCRWLHRELGFFAVGLTLVYAISGVAVNHVRHWDPNYSRTTTTSHIEPPGTGPTAEVRPTVLAALALDEPVKNTWRAEKGVLQVFVEGAELNVDLVTGDVVRHDIARRPLLNDVNFLHLMSPRGTAKTVWTWIADAFCVVLVVLALSGLFLVKGRKGLVGRGGVWAALGILLPIAFLILVR